MEGGAQVDMKRWKKGQTDDEQMQDGRREGQINRWKDGEREEGSKGVRTVETVRGIEAGIGKNQG